MQLLGRDKEIKSLEKALKDSASGKPRLAWINGPAGIGKSTLLSAFADSAENQGLRVLRARVTGPGTTEPYRPIAELVADIIKAVPEPDETTARRWRNNFKKNALEIASTALAAVPGLSVASAACKVWSILGNKEEIEKKPGSESLDEYKDNKVGLFRDLIVHSAIEKPLLLYVDDIQWADAGTLEVVLSLLRDLAASRVSGQSARICIALAFRPADAEASISDRIEATVQRYFNTAKTCKTLRVSLDGLPADTVGPFADALFDQPCDIPEVFSNWLIEETGGNPLHLRAILSVLLDKEILIKQQGMLRLVEPFETSGSPPEVLRRSLEVLREGTLGTAAELATLPAAFRRFLEAGSVWGRAFPVDETAGLAGLSDPEKVEVLRSTLQRGLIHETEMEIGGKKHAGAMFGSASHARFLSSQMPAAQRRSYNLFLGDWWRSRIDDAMSEIKNCSETSSDLAEAQVNQLTENVIVWSRQSAEHYLLGGNPISALTLLVDTERLLVDPDVGVLVDRDDFMADSSGRRAAHRFLKFSEYVEEQLSGIREQMQWPGDLRKAFHLEVEHRLLLGKALADISWYSRSKEVLLLAEMPLDYLNSSKLRKTWLLALADLNFHSGATSEARKNLTEYMRLEQDEPADVDEIKALDTYLYGWPPIRQVREIVARMQEQVSNQNDSDLISIFLFHLIAQEIVDPWLPEQRQVVDRWLSKADPLVVRAIFKHASFKADMDAEMEAEVAEEDEDDIDAEEKCELFYAKLEEAQQKIMFFDVLSEHAEKLGEATLAQEIRIVTLNWLYTTLYENAGEKELAELDKKGRVRIEKLLGQEPFSNEWHDRVFHKLIREYEKNPTPSALTSIIWSDRVSGAEALKLSIPELRGTLTLEKLGIAESLLRRKDIENLDVDGVLEWMDGGARDSSTDPYLVYSARVLSADYYKRTEQAAKELPLRIEIAQYYEDIGEIKYYHDEYERCSILAKEVGDFEVALRQVKKGIRVGGSVSKPPDDLPIPEEPLAAEQEAEKAIEMGKHADEPEIAEAWFRRALRLNDMVPDGITRQDDIHEFIADAWKEYADELVYDDNSSREDIESTIDRVRDELIKAIEVNEKLADEHRVFELVGKILEFEREWLILLYEPESHLDALKERVEDAMKRGDLDQAAQALQEIIDDCKSVSNDLENGEFEENEDDWQKYLSDLRSLIIKLFNRMKDEATSLKEPWWVKEIEPIELEQ